MSTLLTHGLLEGHAARFNELDAEGRILITGCFNETLAKYQAAATMPALIWSHDADALLGRIVRLAVDDIGLFCRCRLNLAIPQARACLTYAKAGELGFSTSFTTAFLKPGTVERCQLREISLSTSPSNPRCRATEVRESLSDAAEFSRFLVECGIAAPEAQLLASRGWSALSEA